MRRLLSLLLASALVASSATASWLHVHEYLEHDHPDHHHGPAAHVHALVTVPAHHLHADEMGDGHALEAAPSDGPGRHAISVSSAAACVQRAHLDVAITPFPDSLRPVVAGWTSVPATDVRVHGPPAGSRTASRAPPLPHLA